MVSRRRIRSQAKFFYTNRWTKAHDVAFINSLAWVAERGCEQSDANMPDAAGIRFATDIVNSFSPVQYGMEFYSARLDVLRQRYETFCRILSDPGFDWNPNTNRVIGSKESWDRLFVDCPFAKAYWWRGERRYEQLRQIFEADVNDPSVAQATASHDTDGKEGDVLLLGYKTQDEEGPSGGYDVVSSLLGRRTVRTAI
ncbi:hypothetical protein Salat_2933800 [Sesamum alatum]|uniref:Myb/SANT-like domain-containing protein n=1 Tax=Sesamum alatum TaxID=300844 RepID=A0AAE2C8G2_9LAMI|nr:hypothetical protein Salat_2933800 [Sesamum alatum]